MGIIALRNVDRRLSLGLFVAACAAWPAQADAGEALATRGFEVLTYNVQFRPLITDFDLCWDPDAQENDFICSESDAGGNAEIYGMDDEARVKEISARIVDDDPAVVVLQEVWRDVAFDAFLGQLGEAYPYYSETPDSYLFDGDPNGSGMMVFSRYAMMPLGPLPDGVLCWQEGPGGCEIASLEFADQSLFYEKVTRKSLSYVMLDNPDTGRPLHVFFTHLQSTGAEADIRKSQVGESIEFITSMTGDGDDVMVLGDLNIRAPLAIPADGAGELANGQVAQEYRDRIVEDFGGIGLNDAWARQSPEDPGFTSDPTDNTSMRGGPRLRQRIDYALVSPGGGKDRGLCPMHAVVERDRFRADVSDGEFEVLRDLSDHFAVSLRVGVEADRCSPSSAPSLGTEPAETAGAIPAAGNVEWFRFDTGGTYSMGAVPEVGGSPTLRITAYAATDLSTPLVPIEDAGDGGAKRPLVFDATGPFYVRVESSDPLWLGAYTLHSRAHRGASFDDAIVLGPFEPLTSLEMTPQSSDPLDRVHVRLHQRALDTGRPQRLSFIKLVDAPGMVRTSVFDADRQPIAGLQDLGDLAVTVDPVDSPISGEAQDLFYTIDREACIGAGCEDLPFVTWWDTDYRQIDFEELVVLDQATLPLLGDDRVTVMMTVDGGDELEIFHGKLDRFAATNINARRPVGFVESVNLRVYEGDPLFDDDFSGGALGFEDSLLGERQTEDFWSTTPEAHYQLTWHTSR